MPLSISRRQFLQFTAAGVGWLAVRPCLAADADAHRVALLADTHISDAPARGPHDCDMTERMRSAVAEITAVTPRLACAVINGDLAWKLGTPGEYARFTDAIAPLQKANVPLHLVLGNHDTRAAFLDGVKAAHPKESPVDGKHVLVVELPRADLIILDSLEPRLGIPGECGSAQLKWLGQVLDRNPTKPAVTFIHHNPQWLTPKEELIGLADTVAFWDILKSRPRVKAHVFGHTHTWKLDKKDGIHLVNLPAVGYPFNPNGVTGWIDMRLTDKGAAMTVHAFDTKHAEHLKTSEVTWR